MRIRSLRPSALDLRDRTTLVFGLMALVLCAVTSIAVWFAVSDYLLGQRQAAAVAQTATHVEQLRTTLGEGSATPPAVLDRLPRSIGSVSFLLLRNGDATDRWYTSSLEVSREDLPPQLLQRVAEGEAARQRIEVAGQPALAVGVPMPEVGGAYFELYPLVDLDETLRVLAAVLVAGTVAIPIGTLALGRWALRPALRPLDRVSAAARAVAAGDLSARLDSGGDPALAPIAASFNETAAALERRVKVDAQFAADVSHELRSPLTSIIGAVDVIAHHRSALPHEGAEMVGLLEHEVGRFARLVEDLLEISRSEAGSAEVTLDDVRLLELVRHAVPPDLVARIETTPAGEHVMVTVDKVRMERVLANLVDNAQRHGLGLSRVCVDATQSTGLVMVEDCGRGLAEQELDRIFERFARSRHTTRESTSGAGLGLSLVARHLALMNGSVSAENKQDGGGARFTVAVPTATTTGHRP